MRHAGWLFLLTLVLGRIHAQPAVQELEEAVDRLWQAGNYAWEEKHVIDFDSKGKVSPRLPTFGVGETEIGGFTHATIQRHTVVFWRKEAAFQLKSGDWRHTHDLTETELREVGFMGTRSSSSFAERRARAYSRPLAHEILRLLLERGSNIRKDGGAIVGDLIGSTREIQDLELYFMNGTPLPEPEGRNSLRAPRGPLAAILPRPASKTNSNQTATFTAWVDGGQITELSASFKSTVNISFDGEPRQPHTSTRTSSIKITGAGSTRIEVPPEARALFLSAPKR